MEQREATGLMAASDNLSGKQFPGQPSSPEKKPSRAGHHNAKGKFHGKGHKSHQHKTTVAELAKVHGSVTKASAK